MKQIRFNTLLKYCLHSLALALLTAGTWSCQKDAELDLPLAVNSNKLKLNANGGSTHIMIYSRGDWNVRFDQPIEWGSLNNLAGTGNYDVVFNFAENLEAPRRVGLIISNDHGIDTVVLIQSAKSGFKTELAFTNTDVSIANNEALVRLPIKTNLLDQLHEVGVLISEPENPDIYLPLEDTWVAEGTKLMLSQEAFFFTASANTTGSPRKLNFKLIVTDGEGTRTTSTALVTQTAEDPVIAFQNEEQEAIRAAGTVSFKLTGNTAYTTSMAKAVAQFPDGVTPWISNLRTLQDELLLDIEENTTGFDRKATIILGYKVIGGQSLVVRATLLQSASDLRMLIPGTKGSVVIEDDLTFEGLVISDAGNLNMEVNPNLSLTSIDFSENLKTAYIQRENGAYGFRLKFGAAADNTLKRYSRVTLSVKGLTLTKEENPTRYTLSGLTAENIVSATDGQASDLRAKERAISQLTDDDIYTFVTLKQMQIGFADGAYTNVHDGYTIQDATLNPNGATSPRADCSTMPLFDNNGDHINMLFNMKTPWRRTGSGVPAGAGDVKGIVVHSKLLRYGPGDGEIGRYAIRTLEEEDIALEKDASSGFATTLVEWNWNDGVLRRTDPSADSKSMSPMAPNIGNGELYTSFQTTPSAKWGPYGISDSYSNKFNNTGTKGLLAKTGVNFNCDEGSWWNFTTNKGEAIIASFATTGITANNMLLLFDIAGGSTADSNLRFPTNWQVEYSTDGVNFTRIGDYRISIRPQVWWSGNGSILTGIFCTPGLANYAVKLPAGQLTGKSKVYIAIRATGTSCAWYYDGANKAKPNAEDAESNTLTPTSKGSGSLRMSTFSVKYF